MSNDNFVRLEAPRSPLGCRLGGRPVPVVTDREKYVFFDCLSKKLPGEALVTWHWQCVLSSNLQLHGNLIMTGYHLNLVECQRSG